MSMNPFQSLHFCPFFSNSRHTSGVLIAGSHYDFVVPAGAYKASFSIDPQGTTYWVDDAKEAALPTTAIEDGSAPEMNPAMRKVSPGQTLSVITAATGATIEVCYYE